MRQFHSRNRVRAKLQEGYRYASFTGSFGLFKWHNSMASELRNHVASWRLALRGSHSFHIYRNFPCQYETIGYLTGQELRVCLGTFVSMGKATCGAKPPKSDSFYDFHCIAYFGNLKYILLHGNSNT